MPGHMPTSTDHWLFVSCKGYCQVQLHLIWADHCQLYCCFTAAAIRTRHFVEGDSRFDAVHHLKRLKSLQKLFIDWWKCLVVTWNKNIIPAAVGMGLKEHGVPTWKHIIPTVKYGAGSIVVLGCFAASGPGTLAIVEKKMNFQVNN